MIKLSAFSDEAGSSISEQIEALHRNQISLMELRTLDGKNVSSFTKQDYTRYYPILKSEGISVWSIGSPLGKVDIDVDFNEYSEVVKRVCDTANGFECDKIRMFSFFNAYDKKNKVFDYLSKMIEIANSFGVKLYHENEKEIYGDTLSRVLEIYENVNGLEYIYDPANFLQVGEKASDTIPALFDKTGYFHIKDVVEQTGELVPAGYGDGDIKTIVQKITKDTVLTLEPHLAIFDAYKNIDNTQLNVKFKFETNTQAFDCAVKSLKDILIDCGYTQKGDCFIK